MDAGAGAVAAGEALLAFVDEHVRLTTALTAESDGGGGGGGSGGSEWQDEEWDAYGESYERSATVEEEALSAAREALLHEMLALHGGNEHVAAGAVLDAAGVVAVAHAVDRICCGAGLTAAEPRR